MAKPMTPEGQIKRDIMDWLNAQPRCYARLIQIAGFRGRKNASKGVSDIVGSWRGRALAIEVKSAKGKLEADQVEFLECWRRRGEGIAIVVRSLDEVIQALKAVPSGEGPRAGLP